MSKSITFSFSLFSTIFSLLFFIGCSSSEPESPQLESIMIHSSNGDRLDLVGPETTVLSVTGVDQFGAAFEIESDVTWTKDTDHLDVSLDALVTPVSVGTTVVTAELEDKTATYQITVWDSSAPRVDIFVSDVGNDRNGPHQIIMYNETGTYSSIYIDVDLSKPQDIVFLEDQETVLVSNLSGNNINKYDINTGNAMGSFATGLSSPTRIDIGPDGLLYAIPWGGGPVKRYQLDGTFVDNFTTTDINEAIGIAWDSQGNMYLASFNNGSNGFVQKFDSNGSDLGRFISSDLSGPTDIWFDDIGHLFVNDWSGNRVQKFDSEGVFLDTFISNVSQPEGVAFLDDGSILIGASGTSSVKMYDKDGQFLRDLVPSTFGSLVTPNAVVVRKVNH